MDVFFVFAVCIAASVMTIVFVRRWRAWVGRGAVRLSARDAERLERAHAYNRSARDMLSRAHGGRFAAALVADLPPDYAPLRLYTVWTDFAPVLLPLLADFVVVMRSDKAAGAAELVGVLTPDDVTTALSVAPVNETYRVVAVDTPADRTRAELDERARSRDVPPFVERFRRVPLRGR